MEDSDSEYEIEEAVVLVELNGIIDSNFLLQKQMPSKILGIETDQPILQIGHYIFSGEYEDTMGTAVAYEPVQMEEKDGSVSETYKFLCKTDKKLSMKRVFLQEKDNLKSSSAESSVNCAIPENTGAVAERLEKTHTDNASEIENVILDTTFSHSEVIDADIRAVKSHEGSSLCGQQDEGRRELKSEISSKVSLLEKDAKFVQNGLADMGKPVDVTSGSVASVVARVIDHICTETASKDDAVGPKSLNVDAESIVKQSVTVNASYDDTKQLADSRSRSRGFTKKRKGEVQLERKKKVCKRLSERDTKSAVKKTLQKLVRKVENENAASVSSAPEGHFKLLDDFPCKKSGITSSSELNNESETPFLNQESKNAVEDANDVPTFPINNAHMHLDVNNEVAHTSLALSESVVSAPSGESSTLHIVFDSDSANQLVESSTDKIKFHSSAVEVNFSDKCSSSGDKQYFKSSDQAALPDICQSSDNESTQYNVEKNNYEDNASSSTSDSNRRDGLSEYDDVTNKNAICEVSQSSKESNHSNSKCSSSYEKNSSECEVSSDLNVEESCDSHLLDIKTSYPSTSTIESDLLTGNRLFKNGKKEYQLEERFSSCEVSQSNGSKRLNKKDEVSKTSVENPVASSSKKKDVKKRHSQNVLSKKMKPEISLSEVSQSHKCHRFLADESANMEYEQEESNQSEICSQSSDLSNKSNKHLYENKDICVSSCDSKKFAANIQLPSTSSAYRDINNVSCEVSQSDKCDEQCVNSESDLSGNREVLNEEKFSAKSLQVESMKSPVDSCTDIPYSILQRTKAKKKLVTKLECKESSCEVTQSVKSDDRLSFSEKHGEVTVTDSSSEVEVFPKEDISASVSDIVEEKNACESSGLQHISNSESCAQTSENRAQNFSCEVSQSFNSEGECSFSKVDVSSDDRVCSNECENYQWCDEHEVQPHNTLTESLKDLCASSDDVDKFTHADVNQNEDIRDPVCEVSQSFLLGESDVVSEAPCVSSDLANNFLVDISVEGPGNDAKSFCEVSQSSRTENSLISEPFARDSSECENYIGSGVLKEACVSSDDFKSQTSKKKLKNKDQNYSCEVSQSYKSKKTNSSHGHRYAIEEVEGSSECDVYDHSQDIPTVQQDPSSVASKETCVSSDDISVSEHSKSLVSENEMLSCEASQSSKNDENFPRPSVSSCSTSKNDHEVCEQSSDLGEEHPELSNEFIYICESSEDAKLDSAISTSEMCSSSDKATNNDIKAEHSTSKICDSISEDLIINEIESEILVSQNEEVSNIEETSDVKTNSSFSDSLLISQDTVNVSSSVDINSNLPDAIYSSSASNALERCIALKPATLKVTQSSVRSSTFTDENCSPVIEHTDYSANVESYNEAICKEHKAHTSSCEVSEMNSSDGHEFNCDDNPVMKKDEVSSLLADHMASSGSTCESSRESHTKSILSEKSKIKIRSNSEELVESSISLKEDKANKTKMCHMKPSTSAVTDTDKRSLKKFPHKLKLSSCNSGKLKEKRKKSLILSENEIALSKKQSNVLEQENSDVLDVPKEHSSPSNVASSTSSRTDTGWFSVDSRPSLLEVIVSSASDFRNSLIHENSNFGRSKNKSSAVEETAESSISNNDVSNELSEEGISEAVGCSSEQNNIPRVDSFPQKNELQFKRNKMADSEVTGSLDSEIKANISGEQGNSQQVSQSTEIVNTHSSTSEIQMLLPEDNESSQRDFVQSSTSVSNVTAFSSINEPIYMLEHVSSADENQLISDVSENAEISDSETFGQIIESSDHGQSLYETKLSFHEVETIESEVSSSPCDIHHTRLATVSADGSGQCSIIEGNMLHSAVSETVIKSDDDMSSNVIVTSLSRDSLIVTSNLSVNTDLDSLSKVTASHVDNALCSSSKSNEDNLHCESSYEGKGHASAINADDASFSNVIESSNEAEILKLSSSSTIVNSECNEDSALPHPVPDMTVTIPHVILDTVVSSSPINEVEIVGDRYTCDGSNDSYEHPSKDSSLCEVTESHTDSKNEASESFADDNKVSCSASECSSNNPPFYKDYTFNENEFCSLPSHEIATKSDDCVSSYDVNVSDDNVTLMQNAPQPSTSNIELSMYTNVADFENDSVQSSSLEDSHFGVSEPIKTISSPPVFSDASCYEEQTTLNTNSFITLPSEGHFISNDPCDLSLNKTSDDLVVEVSSISFVPDVAQSHFSMKDLPNFISDGGEPSCTKVSSEDADCYKDSDFTEIVSESVNESSDCVNEVSPLNVSANIEFWAAQENFEYSEEVVSESHCEEVDNSLAVDSTDNVNIHSNENNSASADVKSPTSTSKS